MSKHTSGTWVTMNHADVFEDIFNGRLIADCSVDDDIDFEEQEANASVTAAVPELYEACNYPGDYGVLLRLAADIIEDRGHERHQGIAKRLREKAKLELAALEKVEGIKN